MYGQAEHARLKRLKDALLLETDPGKRSAIRREIAPAEATVRLGTPARDANDSPDGSGSVNAPSRPAGAPDEPESE